MGMQKMLMPWGNTTVLESVVQTLQNSGIEDIIIVTNLEISKSIFNYQSFNSAQDKLPITINNNGECLPPFKPVCGRKTRQRRQRSFVLATSPKWRKEA